MKDILKPVMGAAVSALLLAGPALAHDPAKGGEATPEEMRSEAQEELGAIASIGLLGEMEGPALGSDMKSNFDENLSKILAVGPDTFAMPTGSAQVHDVVLQPGHFWRTSGATGSQGAHVAERSLAAFLVQRISTALKDGGYDVLVIPADGYPRPIDTQIFLAIHADGSETPCNSAPSMGYDDPSDTLGVHAVGFALATALGYSYDEFMDDGFTKALREYYAFPHMRTTKFEGVLEVGELSCPEEEELLISSAELVASNIALMLGGMADLSQTGE